MARVISVPVLVNELLDRGYAVRVLDRLFYGSQGIDDRRDRIELFVCDMRDIPDTIFEDISYVINVGGFSNDPTAEFNPKANFEMNATATKKLAQAAIKHGIKRYLFASSCSIYDLGVNRTKAISYKMKRPQSPQSILFCVKVHG